jgi:hypothetical protein
MSAQRLKLDPPAKLVARDGTVTGVLTSMTVELYDAAAAGGQGAVVEEQLPLGPTAQGGAGGFDPVAEVWSHYCSVMKPRNPGLDAQARALIRDALKVATLSECKRAIDGCAASPFHMGENERNRKYNRLSQILKGKRGIRTLREQIDMFLDTAEKSGLPSGVTSADPGRVSAAKRDVIDAFDFPGDDQVQERGTQARRWLEEQGFKIEPHPTTGRPVFGVQEPESES